MHLGIITGMYNVALFPRFKLLGKKEREREEESKGRKEEGKGKEEGRVREEEKEKERKGYFPVAKEIKVKTRVKCTCNFCLSY